jgi:hypothetical protein
LFSFGSVGLWKNILNDQNDCKFSRKEYVPITLLKWFSEEEIIILSNNTYGGMFSNCINVIKLVSVRLKRSLFWDLNCDFVSKS